MRFGVDIVAASSHAVLAVRGDVDLATAAELRKRLADAVDAYASVVVDLSGVGFMDSTGLGVLVAAANRAAAAGHRFALAHPQRIVKNALRLVQVDTLIDVYDTVDAAVEAL